MLTVVFIWTKSVIEQITRSDRHRYTSYVCGHVMYTLNLYVFCRWCEYIFWNIQFEKVNRKVLCVAVGDFCVYKNVGRFEICTGTDRIEISGKRLVLQNWLLKGYVCWTFRSMPKGRTCLQIPNSHSHPHFMEFVRWQSCMFCHNIVLYHLGT